MVHESTTAKQEFVFLLQTTDKRLTSQLSESVAGENVRVVAIDRSDAMSDWGQAGRIAAFIIGSDVEDPVRSAQRLHAMEEKAAVILLAKDAAIADTFRQTIRFSPFLGRNVSCLDESQTARLDAALRDSLKAGRYHAIIEQTNSQLAAPGGSGQQGFHKQFINKLLDIAPIGIAIVSRSGMVLGWNREAALIFGRTESQVTGTPLAQLFAGGQRKKAERYIERSFKKGEDAAPMRSLELERDADGQSGQILTCTAAHFSNSGESEEMIVLTIKDITEQVNEKRKREELQESYTRNLENKIQQRTKELKHANKELRKKNSQLVNINKELEAFTYVSSHDLQEPLRKIQAFTDRILVKENQNLSDKGIKYLDFIQSTAGRMQTLIDDLLAFSRIESSERKFEKAKLISIIEEVKTLFNDTIHEKNATIVTEGECEAEIVVFQFRQLMQNLISNALKFSKPNVPPHIKIKCLINKGREFKIKQLLPDKEYCHISVSDNGIGFEEKYHKKIFEVFERLHSRSEYPGTGIGLATVKKIVDLHNGIITARSELNKGTTFDIYLPVQNT